MQREILKSKNLLDENGELTECGYAKGLILDYDRNRIKARSYRIKEWDYYLIANDNYALALTIADNSYMSLVSASLLDFTKPSYITTSNIKPFTFGALNLPSSSRNGDIIYDDGRVNINFLNNGMERILSCTFKNFKDKKTLSCKVCLSDEPDETMVIATPFAEDKKAFYYNQKINCMRANGYVSFDGKTYTFSPKDSFGVLDWGRGVWTYDNTWYWGSLSGLVDGVRFGFNIGYGFGDTSNATENMLFYDGVAHKLDDVTFEIPMKNNDFDYMSPWKFTSSDNRFNMDFVPILDRMDYTSLGILLSNQHQVFGRFTGSAVLDDGTVIHIKDMIGFAERVRNKW